MCLYSSNAKGGLGVAGLPLDYDGKIILEKEKKIWEKNNIWHLVSA